jgi:hypothetical protein
MSAKLSLGDQVVCHIRDNAFVSVYEEKYDSLEIFEIISIFDEGYMVYVPQSRYLDFEVKIDKYNYKKYNMKERFIDSKAAYINEYKIVKVYKHIDGMTCSRCQDFFPMAEPNNEDGTMTCWLCKKYPYR